MTDTPDHDLPRSLGQPATRAFLAAGYTSVDQLAAASRTDVAALHGVGPRALRIIEELLAAGGRSFAD